MYAWEGKSFDEIEKLTLRRKPERYPVYCVVEGNQDDKRVQVTQRFRDVRELSQFLQRMEPQRWGLQGLELMETKQALEEVLTTSLDVFGLTEEARNRHNEVSEPVYRIVDWGKD